MYLGRLIIQLLFKINQWLKWLSLHHPICADKHRESPVMGKFDIKTKGTSLVALQKGEKSAGSRKACIVLSSNTSEEDKSRPSLF